MSSTRLAEPATTIPHLIDHHLQHHPSAESLHEKINGAWRAYSSAEIARLVMQTGLGLYAVGVRTGDRVALLAENSPQWIIADYAIQSIGAITVPIYTTQMASQIDFILRDAGIRVCIISAGALWERFGAMLEQKALDAIIVTAPANAGSKVRVLDEVRVRGDELSAAQPALFYSLRSHVTPDMAASVIYTSGTTGEPKGVVLTHANLTSNAFAAGSVLSWTGRDKALSFLPLSHIFERTAVNMYFSHGVSVYFSESVDAVPGNLREVRPTVMTTVPRLLEKIHAAIGAKGESLAGVKKWIFGRAVSHARSFDPGRRPGAIGTLRNLMLSALVYKKWRGAFGGRIRFIISGGAPLSPSLARIFQAAGLTILQGYGLTETSPVISVNTLEANRIGSVGRVLPDVELHIAEDGEICVRGPNVMKGILNAPQETERVLRRGWFHTGDIGYLDGDGYLYITDRKKDLIKKSSGKAVAPAPIETKLQASPFIDYAALAGEFRNFMSAMIFPNFAELTRWASGQRIPHATHAELLAHPSVLCLYQTIIDGVNQGLNQWEYIAKFTLVETVLSVAVGDLTPTMKVRRRIIAEKFRDRIEAMYV